MDPALGSFPLIGLLEPLLPFLERENMIFGESLMNGGWGPPGFASR